MVVMNDGLCWTSRVDGVKNASSASGFYILVMLDWRLTVVFWVMVMTVSEHPAHVMLYESDGSSTVGYKRKLGPFGKVVVTAPSTTAPVR